MSVRTIAPAPPADVDVPPAEAPDDLAGARVTDEYDPESMHADCDPDAAIPGYQPPEDTCRVCGWPL